MTTPPWDDPTADPAVAIRTALLSTHGTQQRLHREHDDTVIADLEEAISGIVTSLPQSPDGILRESKDAEMRLNDLVARWLPAYLEQARFHARNSAQARQGVEYVLSAVGLEVRQNVLLAEDLPVDFLVGLIGIEVRPAGSTPRVRAYLAELAATGRLRHIVLITGRVKHRSLNGVLFDAPGGKVLCRTARLSWL